MSKAEEGGRSSEGHSKTKLCAKMSGESHPCSPALSSLDPITPAQNSSMAFHCPLDQVQTLQPGI